MSHIVDILKYEAESACVGAGYERELRRLKVLKCQELNQVSACDSCMNWLDCSLWKEHLKDQKFGGSDAGDSSSLAGQGIVIGIGSSVGGIPRVGTG